MLNIEAFGKNLQIERKKQTPSLTQEGLSDISGVSVQTLSGYEMGTKSPTLKNAIKIANALGLSLDYLCDGSGAAEQEKAEPKIEKLADIQSIFDFLCEKIPDCDINAIDDDVFFTIRNCPHLAKYYKDYLTMKKLLDNGTITPDILQMWKDGATKNIKSTSIELYEIPF